MKILYLLCGMPFSGKTTLAKHLTKYLDASYIGLDEINEARGLFGGDGISIEEWEKTHAIAMQKLNDLMPSQQDLVLDDTSCFRWLRDRFHNLGQKHGYKTVLIYLDIPIAEILRRMEENKTTKIRQGVRRDIVEEMAKTFELPELDEIVIKYGLDRSIEEWLTSNFLNLNTRSS